MMLSHIRRKIGPILALAFALGAAGAMAAEVTLAWDAPTANMDGSPLADLSGNIVYYGTEPGVYQAGLDVGLTTQATVTGLQAGVTYYFAVQAYNCWDYPSELSQEVAASTAFSSLPDDDLDGMPDAWELTYFGGLAATKGGAEDDYDADGFINLEEYVAGTSPTDPASGPFITLNVTNKRVNLSFEALQADPGAQRYYALERTDSLSTPAWTPITGYDRILGQDQVVSYVERTRNRAFYRLNIWLE